METIGILECSSIAKGVEAADAILKAAEVSLLYAKPVCPGKYTVLVYGDVAAVQAALEAGERTTDSFLVDSVVIPTTAKDFPPIPMPRRTSSRVTSAAFAAASAAYTAAVTLKNSMTPTAFCSGGAAERLIACTT